MKKTRKRPSAKKHINKNNLVKVEATSKILLRDMNTVLVGQIFYTDKVYAEILQKELWFKIHK